MLRRRQLATGRRRTADHWAVHSSAALPLKQADAQFEGLSLTGDALDTRRHEGVRRHSRGFAQMSEQAARSPTRHGRLQGAADGLAGGARRGSAARSIAGQTVADADEPHVWARRCACARESGARKRGAERKTAWDAIAVRTDTSKEDVLQLARQSYCRRRMQPE